MSKQDAIQDQELHAYVDGELSEQRRIEVEAWLASHPEAAARVRDYQLLRESLHARFDPVLAEPVKLPVDMARRRIPSYARAAGFSALMLVSALLGWTLKDVTGTSATPTLDDLVQPAAFAHQVYSTDNLYPVEFHALEKTSLNNWVSERMHTTLRAPDLSRQGLQFIGGRLLPSTNRMAAQFMYEDNRGQRITLYIRRLAGHKGFTEFQHHEKDGLRVFYWIDEAMGYAVIGQQTADRLLAVANAVHRGAQP